MNDPLNPPQPAGLPNEAGPALAWEPGDLWVFGYGSLMWRPGFAFESVAVARLGGFHRSLCVFSHVHRGTPAQPGLVLGLDRGGSCIGRAFRVAPERRAETVDYLREREQATAVYLERHVPLRLQDGTRVTALVYVADRRHPQYAGVLALEEQLRLVRQGAGISGHNRDYVLSTVASLADLGIRDPHLSWLADRLRLSGGDGSGGETVAPARA
ncbi:cation transport protein ChaC [Pseudoxanthobacter soli DSM 19599]|uniref:glutathione-specific gamma-glutamylcyclotransferase n=1 Tax=Pseudoxanthobacter soli DSM 19599 TaxID=1123029 RepID=A0A1M7ZIG1_9HYPH|nr:gamma-glutamylcyclotransferase [Pseudoxanthobacter soli]SHO64466.1 cation transport protein ChaC [Pseudoxanthobacter soli DSM 19599]